MKYYDVEQNTEQWFELRLGKFTASTFNDLFMKPTTKTYQKAIYKVAFERITKTRPENFTSQYMERGNELESEAREKYELQTFNKVKNGGFWILNDWIGASPDGLIGDNGLLEIKCPAFNTAMEYLIKDKIPMNYMRQIQGQLMVANKKWTDFVVYHPKLKMHITRVFRDNIGIIEQLDNAIVKAKEIIKIYKEKK